jgi:hypothetical protein
MSDANNKGIENISREAHIISYAEYPFIIHHGRNREAGTIMT